MWSRAHHQVQVRLQFARVGPATKTASEVGRQYQRVAGFLWQRDPEGLPGVWLLSHQVLSGVHSLRGCSSMGLLQAVGESLPHQFVPQGRSAEFALLTLSEG